jgi:hypothetical protein
MLVRMSASAQRRLRSDFFQLSSSIECAPCTKSVRRYRSPCLLIRPKRVLPPVLYCLGVKASQRALPIPP